MFLNLFFFLTVLLARRVLESRRTHVGVPSGRHDLIFFFNVLLARGASEPRRTHVSVPFYTSPKYMYRWSIFLCILLYPFKNLTVSYGILEYLRIAWNILWYWTYTRTYNVIRRRDMRYFLLCTVLLARGASESRRTHVGVPFNHSPKYIYLWSILYVSCIYH